MKRSFMAALSLVSAVTFADEAFYRGTLGNATGFSLQIDPTGLSNNSQLLYDNSGEGGLSLIAQPQKPPAFEWHESLFSRSSGDSKKTGVFQGTFAADGASAEGTWSSADGKKKWPFKLTRRARSLRIGDEAQGAWVGYPQFDDLHLRGLNAELAQKATTALTSHQTWVKDMRQELKSSEMPAESIAAVFQSNDCDILLARADLVSLLCIAYEFAGGAHPNSGYYAENYAIDANGKSRTLGLWSVLKKSPTAVNLLSERLIRSLKLQKASLVLDGSIKDFKKELEQDTLVFALSPAGLIFQFSPYAVGSYAEGDFRVVVPAKDVAALLQPGLQLRYPDSADSR